MTTTTKKFIPIWEYCKKYNIDKQKIYRWIREHKIPAESISKVEKTVTRIQIEDKLL